jgi:cytosine/adenosine deaminase-related metal-dependent hydrolase
VGVTDPAAALRKLDLLELLGAWDSAPKASAPHGVIRAGEEMARRLRAIADRHQCECGTHWACTDWEVLNGKR